MALHATPGKGRTALDRSVDEVHDAGERTMQIVALTVDGVEYAFRIESVKEIIRYTAPQPTSSTTPWMRGVINLRGSIVPIIDLGSRLGRSTLEVDPMTAKILVLEQGDTTLGFVVTSVDEVRTIGSDQVQDAPAGAGSTYIDSVVTLDDRLVMLLDAQSLLALEERAA
ncbi:MAG: CheW protein [Thermoleophilia bacterium]|nr:CheW protein [Thermoleophilia bacterium]